MITSYFFFCIIELNLLKDGGSMSKNTISGKEKIKIDIDFDC
jgi:hypothetical protein